jgi:hypothetical protein
MNSGDYAWDATGRRQGRLAAVESHSAPGMWREMARISFRRWMWATQPRRATPLPRHERVPNLMGSQSAPEKFPWHGGHACLQLRSGGDGRAQDTARLQRLKSADSKLDDSSDFKGKRRRERWRSRAASFRDQGFYRMSKYQFCPRCCRNPSCSNA